MQMLHEESSPHFCLRCTHIHSPRDGMCLENLKSNGQNCQCDQDSFVPQKPDLAHKSERYYFQIFQDIKGYTDKVEKTIVTIPGARNMPDWKFEQCCWRYWLGIVLSPEQAKKIEEEGQPETIRRTRQKICEAELAILHDFQQRLENVKEFSPEYWQITKELQKFWTESKYVPTDIEFLKAKGIKESVIFEYSISELNDILPRKGLA